MKEKLNRFAKNITSQYGENGILEYIVTHAKGEIRKVACEFGAWDGKFLSNIYSFWHDEGWRAVLIESAPERYKHLLEDYSREDVHAFNTFITPRGEGSLDNLFKINRLDPNIGILSIDIDSNDYHVWKNIS